MVRICLIATVVALVPMAYDLLRRRPTPVRFAYALFNSSIVFFLFSYQVHEKGILMPLLISACLVGVDPFASAFFSVVATFSMSPLLVRDGLSVAYFVSIFVYLGAFALVFQRELGRLRKANSISAIFIKLFAFLGFVVMALLHILHTCVEPPARYPHLWVVFVETFSAGLFLLAAVYGNVMQWTNKPKAD